MRDLGDYEASGRKTNRDGTRLATESPNPVSDFMRGQYSCVGDGTKGARVSAGSTLSREVKMSELSCDTPFIGQNGTDDLSRYLMIK